MTVWFEQARQLLHEGEAHVIVTVTNVRGHAPREPGAKLIVTGKQTYGTVGGGNLEEEATLRARALLGGGGRSPSTWRARLIAGEGGSFAQCCGGVVDLLFEPMWPSRVTVAIFGVGHVGLALARILSLFDIDLVLVDTREAMLTPERLLPATLGAARVRAVSTPILDVSVTDLPPGTHLLVMTHDHLEDLHTLDMALRRGDLGFIGLIGSSVKWARFQARLREVGLTEAHLARVTTPIGLPQVPGKSPEVIAVAVAAQLAPLIAPSTPTAARREAALQEKHVRHS